MLMNWLKRGKAGGRGAARKRARRGTAFGPRLPLWLEPLEDRTLLSFSTPVLVSVNSAGNAAGNAFSATNDNNPRVLSADGTLEVFASGASNLTGVTDSNGTTDVFVRNLATGATTLTAGRARTRACRSGAGRGP